MAKPEKDHKKVIEHKQWRKAVQGYLASISFVDTCVGRLIDAFDKSPYADNTMIILWSDHGWHLGEKLHWRKFSLWEEATHNVLMAVVPGITKPGRRCSRPVTMVDIYPTLIELCGLTPKAELEGRSLLPLLKNPKAKWDHPALTTHGRNNHSLRSERFRYIRYSDGTEELYDHRNDELEWNNLADNPKYTRIKKRLAKWLPTKNVPDVPRAKVKNKSSSEKNKSRT
jgi:arylsulfatase A-like enzyme